MGNPSLNDPRDAPTSCWSCRHLEGLQTAWRGYLCVTVTCAERGRYTFANTDHGCRRWALDPDAQVRVNSFTETECGSRT